MAKSSLTLVTAGIVLTAVLGAAVLGAAVPVALAGAQPAPVAVGPNQSFVGLVNGHPGKATIEVVCPGPLRVNQHGYALPGQTLGVESPSPVALGYTGTRADSIVAQFLTPSTTAAGTTVTFTDYGNQPLPTTVLLPCDGSSTVVFVPRPTSATARSSRVTVTLEPTCDTPACPVTRSDRAR
jgi:hypothetical protein